MAKKYEIRVRPVMRYIVTEWHQIGDGDVVGGGSCSFGEFENQVTAQFVAEALHGKRVAEGAEVVNLAWLPRPKTSHPPLNE